MKRSVASKKGSCLSFLTGGGSRDEAGVELMRITLKKQGDRKQKLEKLLEKYQLIRAQERGHIRAIKAAIIELKDAQPVSKIRFLADPNIYVDNNLSVQTREFLCLLLNTFYKRYDENSECEKKAEKLGDEVRTMIKNVAYNEELLFKVQKSTINHQVQLEGEMLSEKGKLKEEGVKTKELETQQARVQTIFNQHQKVYQIQQNKVEKLRQIVANLQKSINGLQERISFGEEIKQGNQDKMSDEMVYQRRFQMELQEANNKISKEKKRQATLKKKILNLQVLLQKALGKNISIDTAQHNLNMKLMDLNPPINLSTNKLIRPHTACTSA